MRVIHTPVNRSKLYESTLQNLGGKDAKLFSTLREALTFCAVLGYRERNKLKLDSAAGFEDIAGAQYQLNEAVDILFALALAEVQESDILKSERERECIKIYEEYANGGLKLIQSWLETHAHVDVEEAVWRGLQSIGVAPPPLEDSRDDIALPDFPDVS